MKMVKSLLLGSAAGLVAMAGAQAADLPVKAKPVQYVKICSLYGAGFYYIPGTDTCIKIGGFIRAEMNFNAGGSFNPYHIATLDSRARTTFETTRARGVVTFDTRSQTEYGTLRSYIALGEQATNGASGSAIGIYSNRMFIQWAGFTAGLASSFFDFYVTPRYSNTTNVLGSDTGGGGDTVFAYTAQFGNGFSGPCRLKISLPAVRPSRLRLPPRRSPAAMLAVSGRTSWATCVSTRPGAAPRSWPRHIKSATMRPVSAPATTRLVGRRAPA